MAHGVTRFPFVKVRKQNLLIIKTMNSPTQVGFEQRPHRGTTWQVHLKRKGAGGQQTHEGWTKEVCIF